MSADAFRRRADVLWRRSLDAIVLLPAGADDVITLAGTGIDVWELLDTWRTVETLSEVLAGRYGAEPAVVARDVDALISELSALSALELAADSGGPATG